MTLFMNFSDQYVLAIDDDYFFACGRKSVISLSSFQIKIFLSKIIRRLRVKIQILRLKTKTELCYIKKTNLVIISKGE